MAKNEIITYEQLKQRYGNIQRGMNYGQGAKPTIILMSSRKDAPYIDKEGIDGQIVYEGEDVYGNLNRKTIDQVLTHQNRSLANAAIDYIRKKRKAEPVIVFEKLERNKWIDRENLNWLVFRKFSMVHVTYIDFYSHQEKKKLKC